MATLFNAQVLPDPYIPFGVYAGKHASEVPTKYLAWLRKQGWVDYFRKDLEAHLRARPDWRGTQ